MINSNKLKRASILIFVLIFFIYFTQSLFITKLFSGYNLIQIENFEKHLFLFLSGFFGLSILSRGQLWSYGINSSNFFKHVWYLILFVIIALIFKQIINPEKIILSSSFDKIIFYIVQFIAIPVSNIVFFIGLLQNYIIRDFDFLLKENKYKKISIYLILILSMVGVEKYLQNEINNYTFIIKSLTVILSSHIYFLYNSIFVPLLGAILVYLILFI